MYHPTFRIQHVIRMPNSSSWWKCVCGVESWGVTVTCAISPTGSQRDICTWVLFAAPLSTLTGPQSATDGGKEVLFFPFRSPEAGSISSLFLIHHDGIRILQHLREGQGEAARSPGLGRDAFSSAGGRARGWGGHASPSHCETGSPRPFSLLI